MNGSIFPCRSSTAKTLAGGIGDRVTPGVAQFRGQSAGGTLVAEGLDQDGAVFGVDPASTPVQEARIFWPCSRNWGHRKVCCRVERRRVAGRVWWLIRCFRSRAAVRFPWARFLSPLSEPGGPVSGTGLSSGIMRLAPARSLRADPKTRTALMLYFNTNVGATLGRRKVSRPAFVAPGRVNGPSCGTEGISGTTDWRCPVARAG